MGKTTVNVDYLNELTTAIRSQIPRLIEKTEGCIVVTDTNPLREITIGRNGFEISSNGVIIDDIAPSSAKHKYQNIIEVIGHEPQLGDVIEFFMKIRESLKEDVFFCNDSFVITFPTLYDDGLSIKWDFSKQFLKDQDYATIYSLYHLQNNSFN